VSQTAAAAPILIGVLYDFPQGDGGASFEEAVRLGLARQTANGRLDREVHLLGRQAQGLPAGTARDVEDHFAALVNEGVLAIIGPSISDNGLIVAPLADAVEVPCINYTGGERTRSEFMFHYQVGSLEEEPVILAEYLQGIGATRSALCYDHSPVGRRYAECFVDACGALGIDLVAQRAVSPLSEDLTAVIEAVAAAGPDSLVYLGLGVAARAVALGVAAVGLKVPVVANSSLMFGYARKDWREGWEGWTYTDSVSDHNTERLALKERSARAAAGPVGVAGYDIGRLLGEALARTSHLTSEGVHEALHNVKRLRAATGLEGTTMGFGIYDHGALKGRFLVLRRWEGGRSVEVADQ
jgi:branched-chain amino acid transport system substrate-binding protein